MHSSGSRVGSRIALLRNSMSEDPESNIRNSKIAIIPTDKENSLKIGPRVASQRNSMSEDPESNIRNSRIAMSPQAQGQGQGQGQGTQGKAVKVRSFSGALRTFDENFEKKSCNNGDDNSSDSAICKTSFDKNNLVISSTLDAVFSRSLDEKLLSLEVPAEKKKRNSAKKYLKSLGMSEGMPYLREESPSSLSANLGIFNTIPSKGAALPFVDRRATSLPSDGGKNVDFGSEKSVDSDGDADNDIVSSNDSESSEGEEREKVCVCTVPV